MPGVPKPMKNVVYLVNFILGESNTEEGRKRRKELKDKESADSIILRKSNSDVEERRRRFQQTHVNSSQDLISKSYLG